MLELTDISSNSLSITAQAPLSRHPTCRAPPHATLPDRHETMKLHTRTQHHAQRCSQPAAARRLQVQCSSSSTNTSKPAPPSHDTQPRRDVLLQFASALCVPAAASLVSPAPAAAENGLTTWWKSRRTVNGGQKLLAPLYVAQRRCGRSRWQWVGCAKVTGALIPVCGTPTNPPQQPNPLQHNDRLQEAKAILQQTSSPGPDDLTAALQLVRSSSLNCYIFEALPTDNLDTKASLLTQKLELSVS